VAKVSEVQLTGQKDTFSWLQQNGRYTVCSMYRVLVVPNSIPSNNVIWKLKLPLKVRICIWYLIKGVVLTKDNLAKRHWNGSLKCCFCNIDESIHNISFLTAHMRGSSGE
jgi:hypothetical protein